MEQLLSKNRSQLLKRQQAEPLLQLALETHSHHMQGTLKQLCDVTPSRPMFDPTPFTLRNVELVRTCQKVLRTSFVNIT
jgi:hypothetical protein